MKLATAVIGHPRWNSHVHFSGRGAGGAVISKSARFRSPAGKDFGAAATQLCLRSHGAIHHHSLERRAGRRSAREPGVRQGSRGSLPFLLVSALTHRSFPLPVFEPLRHQKSVQSAEFSPNGGQIVTASLDGTAQVWDAETGQALAPPLRHLAEVTCARFSPDGENVVTCSDDMTARVWDAHSGQALTPSLRHLGRVKTAAFSPNNEWVDDTVPY